MNFEGELKNRILRECDKHIQRYHAYHNALNIEHVRNCKRVKDAPPKELRKPDYWGLDKKFDPFYVRAKASAIAKSVARKISTGEYAPHPPHSKQIPKAGGGMRDLTIYQIPDAAVSSLYFDRLIEKNRHRFSSFSYAYRADRNVHFAIQDIWLAMADASRLYFAEFDFSDFFGSISHAYLFQQFDKNGFFISDQEKQIIHAFLGTREVGIPLGTSLSLFLANVVCWKLDSDLERLGVKFARYADDTVIWTADYDSIGKSFGVISDFSAAAGIRINTNKSEGISLVTRDGYKSELANTKPAIEFLGYSISPHAVSIKAASIRKIKKQISYLLYRNLIQPLKGSDLRGIIIPNNGKDPALLTAIMQVRKYLYGGLTSQQLRNYVAGKTNKIFFKGIMSFYPLVNDTKLLKALDGWLVSAVHRSIHLRSRLLRAWGYDLGTTFPFYVRREDLVKDFRRVKIGRKRLLEVPSFILIQRALEIGLINRGIGGVMNPESDSYGYNQ
jgi:retron-type reverse transcriptase